VSILSEDGTVVESFGVLAGDETARTELPLPRSTASIVIERDRRAIRAASDLIAALDPAAAGSLQAPPPPRVDLALEELIAQAEAGIGRPIAEMSRAQKQRLVRFLDDHGAFRLRRSVETVADILGVSRFTVYNYLDSVRQP
jgi:hypothetical protein